MPRRVLPPLVQRVEHLVALARDKRVLHLGCTNAPYTAESLASGTLLHDRLAAVSATVWGLDADGAGLDLLRQAGHRDLLEADLTDLSVSELPGPVDLVIAGEVVEHLGDPAGFLRGLRPILERDDATLVLTTINAYGVLRFIQYAWPRRGPLIEPVHPDHVAYYSLQTLSLLCRSAGLEVTSTAFYDLGPEHRDIAPRRHQVVNDGLMRWWPQLADGIIVTCSSPGD